MNFKTTEKNEKLFFITKSTKIFIISCICTIILDILCIKLKFYDFILNISGINLLDYLNKINTSSNISQTFIEVIVSIMSIFFAVYFIYIQTFRNRYPLDFVNKYIKEKLTVLRSNFICNIMIGILLFIIDMDLCLSKLVYIVYVVYCIYLFVRMFSAFKLFDPSEILIEYKNNVIDEINNKELNEEEIQKSLSALSQYSEESFSKNELPVAKYILSIYFDLIIYFLENKDKLILNKTVQDKKLIESIEKKLLYSIVEHEKLSINYSYTQYMEESFNNIKEIFFKCIDCNEISIFENLGVQLNELFNYYLFRDNFIPCRKIVLLYSKIPSYLYDTNSRKEWINVLEKEFKYYEFAPVISYDSNLVKVVLGYYFDLLEYCMKIEEYEYYKIYIDNIYSFIVKSITEVDCGVFNFLSSLYISHADTLLDLKQDRLIDLLISSLFDICEYGIDNSFQDICFGVLSSYNHIYKKADNNKIKININKNKYLLTLKAIYFYDKLAGIFIPNYIDLIEEDKYNTDGLIEDIISQFKNIFVVSMLKKNTSLTLHYLNKLDDVILIFKKEDKDIQKKFFELYEGLILYSINIKAAEAYHIIIEQYSDLIVELGKDDKVSEDLARVIIKSYESIGKYCIQEKQIDLELSNNSKLVELLNKLDILYRKKDLYYSALQVLFEIGLYAVENNMDDVIRNISNHLGWIGHKAIENKDTNILKEIINYASCLFDICDDFGISEKTIVFIGTLFIILGAYSLAKNDAVSMSFILSIVKKLRKVELLSKSRIIREYQSSNWDSDFSGKAKEYMNAFYRKVISNTK